MYQEVILGGDVSHLKRVKVFSNQVEVGMFISDLDRDWSETSFLLQGFEVQDDEDISAIKEQCEYVYVDFPNDDLYKKFRLRTTVSTTLKAKLEKDYQKTNIHQEMEPARKAYGNARKNVKGVLEKVMLGEDFEIATVRESVKECVKSIMRNESAMLFMTLIKSKDEYTAEHCLNVGIMCIAFGKFLGFTEEQLEEIGICGMLHDIGKVRVPNHILNKPGKFTPEEAAAMRAHAQLGYEILMKKRDAIPSAIDVAYSHHERLNGNGYPRRLEASQISTFARLVAIVDTFDAITSERCYEEARSIMDAYKVLMAGRESHFDAKMVTAFIEWRGIYPPGSIVQMENGEVGIVIASNPRFKLKPKVLMVLDETQQKHRRQRVVDMSKLDLDAEAHTYRIVKAVPNKAFGVNLQEYVDNGLQVAAM